MRASGKHIAGVIIYRRALLSIIILRLIMRWKNQIGTCYGSYNYRLAREGQMSPKRLTPGRNPLRDVAAARASHVRPISFLLRLIRDSWRCALRCL